MIAALARAVAQLDDPRLRRVLWRALGIAVLVFAALWALCWWLLDRAGTALALWLGPETIWGEAAEWLVALGGGAAVLLVSFLLFPGVMGLAQTLFLDDAAEAVEARHYPALPPARAQPPAEAAVDGLRLAGVTVAVNVVALPAYLVLSFIPPLNLFVFYGVNGYLLGREYFEAVAVRRMARDDLRDLRRRRRGRVTLAGVAIAVMLTIPGVNLLAPVVATAFMVHVYHGMRETA